MAGWLSGVASGDTTGKSHPPLVGARSLEVTPWPSGYVTPPHVLGVPIATVYTWRHRGHGPPGFRVGRHLRFRTGDVAQWVAKRIDQSDRRRPAEIRVSPGG